MQSDLQHPRTKRSGDLSEVRAEDIGIGIGEVRMVENVECVHAKFRVQPLVFEELEMLGESDIQVNLTRTAKGVATQRALGELPDQRRGIGLSSRVQRQQRARRECRRIEVVIANVTADVLLIAGV